MKRVILSNQIIQSNSLASQYVLRQADDLDSYFISFTSYKIGGQTCKYPNYTEPKRNNWYRAKVYKDHNSAEIALDTEYTKSGRVTTLREEGYIAVPYSELQSRIDGGEAEQARLREEKEAMRKRNQASSRESQRQERASRANKLAQLPECQYLVTFETTGGSEISRKVSARDELEAKQKAAKLVKQVRDNTWYVPGDDGYIQFSKPRVRKLS